MTLIQTTGTTDQILSGLEGADAFAGMEDYFGFDETHRFFLPDGIQWIEFKPLNEGSRAKYEAKTSKEVSFNKKTDEAKMRLDSATDRHEMILESVVNWNMFRKSASGKFEPVAFGKGQNRSAFETWLTNANPRIVNLLFKEIQSKNDWMAAEMTVEMIDEEIVRLNEMRTQALKREAAEKNS